MAPGPIKFSSSRNCYLTSWTYICLLEARGATLKAWTYSTVPSLANVKQDLQSLLNQEKLDAMVQNFAHTKQLLFFLRPGN